MAKGRTAAALGSAAVAIRRFPIIERPHGAKTLADSNARLRRRRWIEAIYRLGSARARHDVGDFAADPAHSRHHRAFVAAETTIFGEDRISRLYTAVARAAEHLTLCRRRGVFSQEV